MAKYYLCSIFICCLFLVHICFADENAGDCSSQIDLVLLVDASSSMDSADSEGPWNVMVAFMSRILDAIHISPNHSHVAMLTFSDDVVEHFDSDDFLNKSDVISELYRKPDFAGHADVLKATNHVRTEYFSSRHKRQLLPVILILTNQRSANLSDFPVIHGTETFFVVGASREADRDFLRWLSAPPHQENEQWWPLPNYAFLSFFTDKYLPFACIPKEVEMTTSATVYEVNTRCPDGYYGSNCSQVCHCANATLCDDMTGDCPNHVPCAEGWTGHPTCQITWIIDEPDMKASITKTYDVVVVVVPCVVAVMLLMVILGVVTCIYKKPKSLQTAKDRKGDDANLDSNPGDTDAKEDVIDYTINDLSADDHGLPNISQNIAGITSAGSDETVACGSPGSITRNLRSPLPPVPGSGARSHLYTGSTQSLFNMKIRSNSTSTETDVPVPQHVSSLTALYPTASFRGVFPELVSDFLHAKRSNGLIVVTGQRSIPSRFAPKVSTADDDDNVEYVEIRETANVSKSTQQPNDTTQDTQEVFIHIDSDVSDDDVFEKEIMKENTLENISTEDLSCNSTLCSRLTGPFEVDFDSCPSIPETQYIEATASCLLPYKVNNEMYFANVV